MQFHDDLERFCASFRLADPTISGIVVFWGAGPELFFSGLVVSVWYSRVDIQSPPEEFVIFGCLESQHSFLRRSAVFRYRS